MPVVCEGFQESLDDGSLSREPEGLQVEPQGLVDAKPLEGERAAKIDPTTSFSTLLTHRCFGENEISTSQVSNTRPAGQIRPVASFSLAPDGLKDT